MAAPQRRVVERKKLWRLVDETTEQERTTEGAVGKVGWVAGSGTCLLVSVWREMNGEDGLGWVTGSGASSSTSVGRESVFA
jgi:hypothetical protein